MKLILSFLGSSKNVSTFVFSSITSAQILNQNLVTLVKDILKETKLEAKYLELELTENIIVGSVEVIQTINNLKKLGVVISIDDFGTGYSSLSSLRKNSD